MKLIDRCLMVVLSLSAFSAFGQSTNTSFPNVIVWGDNSYGQTNVPSDLTNAVSVSAGDGFCLALKSDGTVEAWGDNHYQQCDVPPDLTNIISVAAGSGYGCT